MDGFSINSVLDFLQTGFNQVNAAQGLAIGLLAAILMRKWVQWPAITALAVIVHAIVDTAIPIVAGRQDLKLPPLMSPEYWQNLSFLYVGYFVIVALFFIAKGAILRLTRGAGARSAGSPPPAAPGAGPSRRK